MPITCPQCHTRCRLKTDKETSDSRQGRCPKCGHIFIIPPGVKRDDSNTEGHSEKQKKAGYKPGFKTSDIKNFFGNIIPSGKTSLFWVLSGLSLTILLAALFFGPHKASQPGPQQETTTKTLPTTTKQPAKFTLTPQVQSKAIAQIKHHALVGDANISIANNQLQLALLVAGSTPITYAERLGRQFAHYLKEQLTETQQKVSEHAIKVSVYYPSGTRIEVATNGQSGEEEILPQINYQK